ncbi:CLOCK-interacting pacemaker [Siphateles boraxobius]|uniref:CLOCK-interacting pacemaker n=1 Tax=Siphateles boraxobius TaxID=180520 RepID=UPI0040648171
MKDEDCMRAMAKFRNRRMEKWKPESERDSGFSDGSSEHRSVIEDSRSPLAQGLAPMIIMNSVVLKQSGEARVKPWPVDVVPQPQVVFLQPVVPKTHTHTHTKHTSQRRRHRKLLPIRKSYPRIAPHPGDNPLQSNSSSSSVRSSGSSHSDGAESNSFPDAPVAETSGESDARPESTDNRFHSHTDNRSKRFCNTYNILSSSGLLDITLRTKDLIRQNRRTQSELDRLREHTHMFLRALETGDPAVWRSLETSLQEQ